VRIAAYLISVALLNAPPPDVPPGSGRRCSWLRVARRLVGTPHQFYPLLLVYLLNVSTWTAAAYRSVAERADESRIQVLQNDYSKRLMRRSGARFIGYPTAFPSS
jgi:hypothetical protein